METGDHQIVGLPNFQLNLNRRSIRSLREGSAGHFVRKDRHRDNRREVVLLPTTKSFATWTARALPRVRGRLMDAPSTGKQG
jgi:hypothetical protein